MTTALVTRDDLDAALSNFSWDAEVVAQTKEFKFVQGDDEKLYARVESGNEYRVTAQALETALTKVPGLQKAAVTQWPVDLFLDTVNWFYEHGDGDARGLVKNEQIIGFTKDADKPMYPVNQVLDQIQTTLSETGADISEVGFNNVRVDFDRAAFGLVVPSKEAQPKKGDVVQAGIWVHHSPTSKKPGEIASYVNRLVCTNGMISQRSLQKWTWRGGGSFMDWVGMATEGAWNSIDAEFEGLKQLTKQPLNGHASVVLEDLFETHRVPSALRESVMEAVIDEGDGTMYGIAQAFNRAANQVDDITQMRGLLAVTGDVVAQEDRCGSCFRSL